MRKLVAITVIVLISMMVVEKSFCQSQIYSGDKSLRENRRTIRLIHGQVSKYQENISLIVEKKAGHLNKEDSLLIVNYRQKIDILETSLNNLIVSTSGKDTKEIMNLESKDPRKSAEAYLLVKYADNIKSSYGDSSELATESMGDKLKGIVVNNWCNEVTVKVTGPANFYREFNLKPNGKSPVFVLPFIGEYTTVFIYGNETRIVTKKVGPNIIYYDGAAAYDYKATLLRN